MLYYFAYGSNMDQEQMRLRCPESNLVGKAVLKGYKIGFTIFSPKRKCGCADILRSKQDQVWGILYEINNSDLDKLDDFEAHPYKYKRFSVKVLNDLGIEFTAEAYEVVDKSTSVLKPSRHYLKLMTAASKLFNFPEEYQLFLLNTTTID